MAEHKVIKNLASSTGLVEAYAGHDYVTPRVDPAARIVEIPRPAGVVLALTPSTNPVATVFVKAILALMTRNAVVVSPHPLARECSADAARTLAAAAVAAGAPDGVIQVVDEPSVPLINALMTDERTSVIVATGGSRRGPRRLQLGHAGHRGGARQRAGFRCGRCGPAGSRPPDRGQQELRQLHPVHQRVGADRRPRRPPGRCCATCSARARTCSRRTSADKVRDLLFPGGHFDTRFVGKDATWIAAQAGLRVPGTTRVLLAPFPLVVPEEPLAHEKLCPVLGLTQVRQRRATASTRRGPCSGSAGAATRPRSTRTDPATIMDYGAALEVLRVVGQRGVQPGQRGRRDRARAVDDHRDRVLRALLGRREPAAQASRPVDPSGL